MAANQDGSISRRGFLTGLAAGSAVLAVSGPLLARTGTQFPQHAAQSLTERPIDLLSPELRRVLSDLAPGARVLPSWCIGRVTARPGAVAVFLTSDEGQELRIDLCRRDPESRTGVAVTEHFELVVMNAGTGQTSTPRVHEQAVRVLAEVLRKSERTLTAPPSELQTHSRRLALFRSNVLHHPEPAGRV